MWRASEVESGRQRRVARRSGSRTSLSSSIPSVCTSETVATSAPSVSAVRRISGPMPPVSSAAPFAPGAGSCTGAAEPDCGRSASVGERERAGTGIRVYTCMDTGSGVRWSGRMGRGTGRAKAAPPRRGAPAVPHRGDGRTEHKTDSGNDLSVGARLPPPRRRRRCNRSATTVRGGPALPAFSPDVRKCPPHEPGGASHRRTRWTLEPGRRWWPSSGAGSRRPPGRLIGR
jgi:hypothetical protein